MASRKPEPARHAGQEPEPRDVTLPVALPGGAAPSLSKAGLSLARPTLAQRLAVRLSDTGQDLRDAMAVQWLHEREAGGLFNLVPVCIAIGIAGYFQAQSEPLVAILPLTAIAALAIAMSQRLHGAVHAGAILVMLIFAGAALAQWRTLVTSHPVLETALKAQITGLVIDVDTNARGAPRYLVRSGSIENVDPGKLPYLLRISAGSKGTRFKPGDAIKGLASLQPLSGPAYPGGYDFGFFARYDGIGGAGFFMGAPQPAISPDLVPVPGLVETATIRLNQLRQAIAGRIRLSLPGDEGAVATALITGDRSAIPARIQESLRQSGLAHILAISGLHMALVTLTVVSVVRYLLAWFPALALNHPIRKWAACAGLLAASLYLLISGASVATQRAWLMIMIMLAATLADRRAFTVRNVALAATIILCLTPEALLEPGFQMSFAAAAALVAAYEAVTERNARRYAARGRETPGWLAGMVKSALVQVSSLAFTSIVAGIATGLFAAWHFHRVAPMGFVANLAAMPVVSFLVMPLALVSSLLMPYGMEFLTLDALGWSIRRVVEISDWTNSFGMSGVTGAKPVTFLLLGAAGLCLITLLRSHLRFFGLLPIALMPFSFTQPKPPAILVSQDGRAVAFASVSGKLLLAYPRRNAFVSEIWLRAYSGGTAETDRAVISECNKDHCLAKLPNGLSVDIVYAPKLLAKACENADILIAPRLKWVNCKGRVPLIVLKRGDFESHGTHALTLPDWPVPNAQTPPAERRHWLEAAVITTAIQTGTRPWQRIPAPDLDSGQRRDGNFSNAGSGRRGAPEPLPDPG